MLVRLGLKRVFHWQRQHWLLLLAALVLLYAALLPWYRLPSDTLSVFATHLRWSYAGRIVSFGLAIGILIYTCKGKLLQLPRLPLWGCLVATLLFPYFLMTWTPALGYLATAYYDQGSRVSQYIERSFPEVQAEWKRYYVFLQSPRILKVIRTQPYWSIQDQRSFQLSAWDEFLKRGLGYGDHFFAFIGRGWGLTLTGLAIALMGCYLTAANQAWECFGRDMKWVMPGSGLVLGLIVATLIGCQFFNYQLEFWMARGEYQQVVQGSRLAEQWYPPFQGDPQFLRRLAAAEYYLGRPDPALMAFAQGWENYHLPTTPKLSSD